MSNEHVPSKDGSYLENPQLTPLRRVQIGAEIGAVLLEIVPLTSNVVQYGALAYTQLTTHNIALSAAAYGGVTFGYEIVSAICMADLLGKSVPDKALANAMKAVDNAGLWLSERLGTDAPHNLTARSIAFLGKASLDVLKTEESNKLGDFGLALSLGTPLTLLLKQKVESERTPKDNRRLGFILATTLGGVYAAQGAAIAAGIAHPSPETVGLATLSIIAFLGLQHWASSGNKKPRLKDRAA